MQAHVVRQTVQSAGTPVFVVGVPRSGTTLLAAILNSHPRLCCGPETHTLARWQESDRRTVLSRSAWPDCAVDYLYSIEHVGRPVPENYGLRREAVSNYLATKRPSLQAVVSVLPELFMVENGKNRWVEKTPDHLPHVERIRQIFPTAPIIRIVRDPRDVALSLEGMPWFPGTFVEGIQALAGIRRAVAVFLKQTAHPAPFGTKIFSPTRNGRYVGFARSWARTLNHECSCVKGRRNVNRAGEPWKIQSGQPLDNSNVERWRRTLSPEKKAVAEAILGDRMMAFGYPIERPGRLYAFVHPWGAIDDSLVAEIAAHQIRLWPQQPQEQPRLVLFVGLPGKHNWLPAGRARTGSGRALPRRVCADFPVTRAQSRVVGKGTRNGQSWDATPDRACGSRGRWLLDTA